MKSCDGRYFVYVLLSQRDNNFYIGFSKDVAKRLREHNDGLVLSTKHRRPFKLVYCEEFAEESRAIQREKYLKGKGGIKFKDKLKKKLLRE